MIDIKKRRKRRIKPELPETSSDISKIEESEVTKPERRRKVKRNNYVNENKEEINDNNDDPYGYLVMEKFFRDNYLFISPTFEDCIDGNRPLKRRIIVGLYLLLQLIVIIRFAIIAIVNKPWIWILLADQLYLLKTGNLCSLLIFCWALNGISVNCILLYFEPKLNKTVLTFLQIIRNNESEYKLQDIYYDEFCKKSKFIIEWAFGPFFKVFMFIVSFVLILLSIKAYLDPDMSFSITVMILTIVMLFVWLYHCLATILGPVILSIIVTLHLKYQYKQIKEQVKQCVKSGSSHLLFQAIKEHNHCSEFVYNFNKAVSFGLFNTYFLTTPAIDILIHLIIYKSINVYMRILYSLITIQIVGVLYIFTYGLSSLSTSAHNITSDLYTFMFRNRSSFRNKIKILAFIEKLCGPVIGFYCYDLFAFTTIEFYEYMALLTSTYFLLNGLLFEV